MALLPARAQRIRDQIAKLEAQRDALDEALLNGMTAGGGYVQSYRFDSGEGSQQTTYRRIDEVKRQLDRIDSEIERLWGKLENTGLVNINIRRTGGTGGHTRRHR